ncbi:MAG: 3-dehydroquinate dehydratase [Deltaproteobacteria bacterium]|nr:3-dehydroquinate dehydratase [Deltaproteobacteria bacterium]
MKILVLHGPNLNLLGERQTDIYGKKTLEEINSQLAQYASIQDIQIIAFQSNHEGELIDKIQEMRHSANGMLINPAGFAHTSVALYDSLLSYNKPIVEVHITQPFHRETMRHPLITARAAQGYVAGMGWKSYVYGLTALIDMILAK